MLEVAFFLGGYLIQLAGTASLIRQVHLRKSAYGLSIDSLTCHLIATASRCIWTFDTRLLEWPLSYVEMVGSLILGLVVTAWSIRLRSTMSRRCRCPVYLSWKSLTAVALCLALAFHPGGPDLLNLQALVAFTIYLEAFAVVPQLRVMRSLHDADALSGPYITFLALSRLVRLLFWACLWIMGDRFWGLMAADAIHTILTIDYIHVWSKTIRKGGFGIIPSYQVKSMYP